jgi:hypothetical protein
VPVTPTTRHGPAGAAGRWVHERDGSQLVPRPAHRLKRVLEGGDGLENLGYVSRLLAARGGV